MDTISNKSMESFLVHFGVDVASALVAQEEFGVCVDVNVGGEGIGRLSDSK